MFSSDDVIMFVEANCCSWCQLLASIIPLLDWLCLKSYWKWLNIKIVFPGLGFPLQIQNGRIFIKEIYILLRHYVDNEITPCICLPHQDEHYLPYLLPWIDYFAVGKQHRTHHDNDTHNQHFVRESTHHWWLPLTKGPVIRILSVAFAVSLNMLLNKQSNCREFEASSHAFDATVML